MKWKLKPEWHVALFVLLTVGVIGGMALRVSNDPTWKGKTRRAWFYVDDASGLERHSNVMMGGIHVGVIKKVTLERDRARVDVVVEGDVLLTSSTRVEIRPDGILGDKHIELVSGNLVDPLLRDGSQIVSVEDRASVDRLINEVTRISRALDVISINIKQALNSDSGKPLGRIIRDLDQLTGELAELTQSKRADVGEIIGNVHAITKTLNGILNERGQDGLLESLKVAFKDIQKVEKSIQNIEQITGKINHGTGSIGRLVNDEDTVDQIMETISTVNAYMDEVNKIETIFDFHSAYLGTGAGFKTALGLTVQPGIDRYYELGLIYDTVGVNDVTLRATDGNPKNSNIHTNVRFEDAIRFNLLFAKCFGSLTLKGGIIETAGGAAVSYDFMRRKYNVTAEAFNFPRVNFRVTGKVDVWKGIYAYAGIDDTFNRQSRFGPFFGVGYSISSDDLKLFLATSSYKDIPNSHQ